MSNRNAKRAKAPSGRLLHAEPAPFETVNQMLDALKAKERCGSENQLAIAMGWSPSKLRNYRKGRARPADAEAIAIALRLNIHEGMALAICHAERCEQNAPERRVWLYIARSLSKLGAAALVVGFVATAAPPAAAAPSALQGDELYIMRTRRRRKWFTPPRVICTRRRRSRQRCLAFETIAR